MADIKRLNYFTNQFLVEKDFDDEQAYHIDMRRRHNRVYHSWGVTDGLEISKTGSRQVTVSPGTAINNKGEEIIVLDSASFNLTTAESDTTVYLTIAYQEVFDEADHYSGGVNNYTRTTERPKIESKTERPSDSDDGSVILLAQIELDGDGNINGVDNSVREIAGSKIADGSVGNAELANNAVTQKKIADNAVDAAKILNGSVGNAELADNAVTANKIKNGTVGNAELADNAVTQAKIADNAVNAAKIQNGSIGTAELAKDAVTADKIKEKSVSVQKLKVETKNEGTITINAKGARRYSISSKENIFLTNPNPSIPNLVTKDKPQPRVTLFSVYAYSTTVGATFEWNEYARTYVSRGIINPLPLPSRVYEQGVQFNNLSDKKIEIKFTIYTLSET